MPDRERDEHGRFIRTRGIITIQEPEQSVESKAMNRLIREQRSFRHLTGEVAEGEPEDEDIH